MLCCSQSSQLEQTPKAAGRLTSCWTEGMGPRTSKGSWSPGGTYGTVWTWRAVLQHDKIQGMEEYIVLDFTISRPVKARPGITLIHLLLAATNILFRICASPLPHCFLWTVRACWCSWGWQSQHCELLYFAREPWPSSMIAWYSLVVGSHNPAISSFSLVKNWIVSLFDP